MSGNAQFRFLMVSIVRETILTIDKPNNEVFQTTKNVGTKGCDLLGAVRLPLLKKPRVSKLYPGYDKSIEFWEKRKKETTKFFNTDHQKLLKTLQKNKKMEKESESK